jgi:pimeloyl-ACP methyl ester carboxylesterase
LPQAVLILPGFGISHVAYSEVASRLADAGILAVVLSMEPLRFAHRHLGADVVSLTRIMQRIQGTKDQVYEWHLLGHSAGALAAMHLYQQFHLQPPTNPTIHVRKLILWGCAALITMGTDLSKLFQSNDPVSILLVQATDDKLLEMTTEWQPQFQQYFPPLQTQTEWIQGGTHHGFASYEPTWVGSPNVPTAISYSQQQDEACHKTIAFLQSASSTANQSNDKLQGDTG